MPRLLPTVVAIAVLGIGEAWSPTDGPPALEFALGLALAAPVATYCGARCASLLVLRRASRGNPVGAVRLLRRGRLLLTLFAGGATTAALWAGGLFQACELAIPGAIPGLHRLLAITPFIASLLALHLGTRGVESRLLTAPLSGAAARIAFRQTVLLLGPYLLCTTLLDLAWYFPTLKARITTSPLLLAGILSAGLFGLLLLAPLVVRHLWPSRPLPPGPLRARLEAVAREAGTRIREIVIWNTGPLQLMNASISGLWGPIRLVFITDGLLARLDDDELVAVFGHELGHARRRHFLVYLLVIVTVLLALMCVEQLIVESAPAVQLTILGSVGLAVWAGFGALSRQLEIDADLFGARHVGVEVYARTLHRIGQFGGILDQRWSWRHPTIRRRIEVVTRCEVDGSFHRGLVRRTRVMVRAVLLMCALSGLAYGVEADRQQARPGGQVHLQRAQVLLDEEQRHLVRGPDRTTLQAIRAEIAAELERALPTVEAPGLRRRTLRHLVAVHGRMGHAAGVGRWLQRFAKEVTHVEALSPDGESPNRESPAAEGASGATRGTD